MTTTSATRVTVDCPAWCNVTQAQHLRELRWEGNTTHWSDSRSGDGWEIRHTATATADGSPSGPARLYVSTPGGLTLASAEALALTLLATYEEASD
ncbi:hypothetical protein [Nocardioides cynanchi]|uniref:hypothetical protein n=1 Tax=Nocardioides cynanchi TaxID=2558918 RepID=UPI001243E468|nr:hypothetical protein [Nocardioides cynanchi]